MDRDQSRTDLRIEWAIPVLGLAGVVAIFVPFPVGLSPLAALPVLRTGGGGGGVCLRGVRGQPVATGASLIF